jgi:dihydrolipoamide dehydrogenase
LIDATATFESKNSIKLDLNNQTHKIINFKKAVIATGSRSLITEYEGDGVNEIITNSDFFAKMELPDSLSIIGSGAIAIEFSQILASLGVKINLFVRGDKILKNIDKEASKYLFDILKKDTNIDLILNSTIQRVDKEDDYLKITYIQDKQIKTIKSRKILSAAGRVANIDNLKLENANVEFNNRGIITNKHLATSNPNIYANGDVVDGFPKFAHTAQYGAHTIAQNLFLEHDFFSINYDKNSWVLFSMPNVAMAGISEEEAKKRGLDVIVDKFDFSTEAKSQINKDDYGYLKFIVEKGSNKIIGISILHNEAHSLGGEAALIVANKLKLKDIIDSIHPHPTISEAYVMLAKKMMGEIMLKKLEKPIVKSLLKIERWL